MIDISERKQAEENIKNTLTELTIANKEILFQSEERKKREEELVIINKELEHSIQLNNEKNLFISILGHDLRNQFSGVLGFSELLQENIHLYTTAEIKDFINKIYICINLVFYMVIKKKETKHKKKEVKKKDKKK